MSKEYILDFEKTLIPQNMLRLYSIGAFPMADKFTENINWYKPEVRCIIPLDNFNIPRSLKKIIQNSQYEIKYDFSVLDVIINCSKRKETWISPKLIEAYKGLIKIGVVHSVEVWNEKEMVGGLYGIAFKGAFFGESMFSFKPQTSKIALYYLIQNLIKKDFILLDVQYQTEHLAMFGAKEISFENYELFLEAAYKKEVSFL